MLASLLYVQRKGMKPFGFILFLLLCKIGGMTMNEYRRIIIHLQINPGELVIIVGESGAGKTTLLKLITGLYKPSNGSIAYYGNKARMTTVWQEPRFFRTTVKENMYFGEGGLEKQLEKNMELVNVKSIIRSLSEGIQTVLHKSGEEFSGGERKRLALLRAIVSNPNLIILDEPTAGLDPSNQEVVWNMLKGLGGM